MTRNINLDRRAVALLRRGQKTRLCAPVFPLPPPSFPLGELRCPFGSDGDRLLVQDTDGLLLRVEDARLSRLDEVTEQEAREVGLGPCLCVGHTGRRHLCRFIETWQRRARRLDAGDNPLMWLVEVSVVRAGASTAGR